jgi:hypothetical protein
MQELEIWPETKLEGRDVEPNASLGKTMKYMLKK